MHKCSDWKDLANAALVRVAERGRSPSSSPSNAPTQRQAGVARPSPGPLQCQRWRRCPSGSAPSSPALALGYHVGLTGVAVVGGGEMRKQGREPMHPVLASANGKSDANQLAPTTPRSGVCATSIPPDRRQEDRIAALEAFRRGEYPVLVATDVAARGLDVEGISHIVNFDVPFSSDDYIHRAGRTARAGAAGDVITFVSPAEEEQLCAIEKMIGAALPRVVLPNFDHGTHRHVPLPVGAPARTGRSRRRRRSRGSRRDGS